MNRAVALVLNLVVLASPCWAAGQAASDPMLRIGAINLPVVAQSSKFGSRELARIDAATREREAEVVRRASELERQRATLTQSAGLSDRVRTDLQRAFERQTVEFERYREDAAKEVQRLQDQFTTDFQVRLRPVIDAIAKDQGLSLIFNLEVAPIV